MRTIAIRKTAAAVGAIIGLQLMLVAAVLVPVHVAFRAQAVAAQGLPSTTSNPPDVPQAGTTDYDPTKPLQVNCFTRGECIDASKASGDCDDQHCFEKNEQCKNDGGRCFANPPAVPLVIRINGRDSVLDLGDYIATLFNYGVILAGIFASVMFMVGGFQVLTAVDSDRVKHGKERIKNALIGVVLLLFSYTLLQTINPDLVRLRMPRVEITKKKVFSTCAFTEVCAPCGVPYVVLTEKGTGRTAASSGECGEFVRIKGQVSAEDLQRYDVGTECTGQGCGGNQIPQSGSEPQCGMAVYTCGKATATSTTFACGHAPDPVAGASPSNDGTSNGYICKACKADGESCGAVGASDECCGRSCSAAALGGGNICSSGEPGDACQSNSSCKSGRCQTNWGNSCSSGAVGSPCAGNKECANGLFCSTTGVNTCSQGTIANYCDSDEECAAGLRCAKPSGYPHFCAPASVPDSGLVNQFCKPQDDSFTGKIKAFVTSGGIDCCDNNNDCSGKGGFCYASNLSANFCTTGSAGSPCANAGQCQQGLYCVDLVCTTGNNGSVCSDDNDCRSKHCYVGGDYDVCVSGGLGSRCDSQDDCNGSDFRCDQNRCVSSQDAKPPAPSGPTGANGEPVNPFIGI